MGDTKEGRDKQARDEENRARERAVREELARYHETEPPRNLDDALDELDYPAPAADVVEAAGDYDVQTADDAIPVTEVVEQSVRETYESADDARVKLRRPSVAAALRRLRSVSREVGLDEEFRQRQDVYRKTLQSLEAIDADDEDEGIATITAWLVEEMRERERLPSSRKTRQRATEFCRNNDYEVRDDSWLGA